MKIIQLAGLECHLAIKWASILTVAAFTLTAHAGEDETGGWARFARTATLPNYLNNPDIADETVSEIVSVTNDGMTLVYTDSVRETVGFVDINTRNQAVVTFQENNHLAVVDLRSGTVVNDFGMGAVTLVGVDDDNDEDDD